MTIEDHRDRLLYVIEFGGRAVPVRPVIEAHASKFEYADVSLYLTQGVLESIIATIGNHQPETGGMLFGPADRMGVDLFEYDNSGSARSAETWYAPDKPWSDGRVQHHATADPARTWWGQVHSHPGRARTPSPASGPNADGDLGYIASVFELNEAMRHFWFPIVTFENGEICVHPFLFSRESPEMPKIARQVCLCEPSQFPAAQYMPGPWLDDAESDRANFRKQTRAIENAGDQLKLHRDMMTEMRRMRRTSLVQAYALGLTMCALTATTTAMAVDSTMRQRIGTLIMQPVLQPVIKEADAGKVETDRAVVVKPRSATVQGTPPADIVEPLPPDP